MKIAFCICVFITLCAQPANCAKNSLICFNSTEIQYNSMAELSSQFGQVTLYLKENRIECGFVTATYGLISRHMESIRAIIYRIAEILAAEKHIECKKELFGLTFSGLLLAIARTQADINESIDKIEKMIDLSKSEKHMKLLAKTSVSLRKTAKAIDQDCECIIKYADSVNGINREK